MALDDEWKPLHVRMGQAQTGPFEGIPGHLVRVLEDWFKETLTNLSREDEVELLLRLRLEQPYPPSRHPLAVVFENSEPYAQLVLIDAVLPFCAEYDLAWDRYTEAIDQGYVAVPPQPAGMPGYPNKLRRLLELGGSVWTVARDGRSLLRRVDPTVETAIEAAAKDSSAASSRHLRGAYAKAFGINPDPGTSYRQSIQAVESAAWPHVTPQNPKQTLGTMIADLRQKPEKWTVVISSDDAVDCVRSMMEMLWRGQIDRHGHVNLKQVTQEAAEAAVFLAATLVQWFNTGAIQPTP